MKKKKIRISEKGKLRFKKKARIWIKMEEKIGSNKGENWSP